jgi:hypothetical protein
VAAASPAQRRHRNPCRDTTNAIDTTLPIDQRDVPRAPALGSRIWGDACSLQVFLGDLAAAAFGLISEIHFSDQKGIPGCLLGEEVRDQARLAKHAREIVNDKGAPVEPGDADDLPRLSSVNRCVLTQTARASGPPL